MCQMPLELVKVGIQLPMILYKMFGDKHTSKNNHVTLVCIGSKILRFRIKNVELKKLFIGGGLRTTTCGTLSFAHLILSGSVATQSFCVTSNFYSRINTLHLLTNLVVLAHKVCATLVCILRVSEIGIL